MDWLSFLNVIIGVIFIICCVSECGPLNDYILDYQPLVYDRDTVHKNHQRVRRSADNHLHLRFTAYGRNFQLKLAPSQGIFSPHHQLYIGGKLHHSVDTSFIYEGQVKGEPSSSVHLSVHNGSIEGHVQLPETTYHIEPANKYVNKPPFHTIIYPETHLNTDPYRERREAEKASSCGVDHSHILEFMEQASQLAEEPIRVKRKEETWVEREQLPHNIYTEFSNQNRQHHFSRHRRAAAELNKTCPLHVRADPLLYRYFLNKNNHSGISDVKERAQDEILAFFASHVKTMSTIYSNTAFKTYNGDLINAGLNFVIHRSTIMEDCRPTNVDPRYCTNSLDVSNFLDLTSQENHNEYCLVFTFTYRDFSGGVLGLAWVATEANVQSGVCGRYSQYTNNVWKSLNTGIVTIINYGKTVPNRVSQLTFAHEAGHNFGSPHDIGSEKCAPFGTGLQESSDGNFIMFPSATSGDKAHNDKFSECSKDNMTRIIQQVVRGVRHQCFVQSGQAFCGNQITEGSEECDCGFGDCPDETCCTGRQENNSSSGCIRKNSTDCSPDSGPCCAQDCTFKNILSRCREESECKMAINCNGSFYGCPEPDHKPNGTYCNGNTKVCNTGECIGSVCTNIKDAVKWEECFQASENGQSSELCFVACKKHSSDKCISSQNAAELDKSENHPFQSMLQNASNKPGASSDQLAIRLPPGSPCDNFRGYCDTFSKCQRIDSQGPFNQLTNMIFDPVTLNKVKDWIVEYWWAVLLMSVGLVVVMGVFIKVFSYNTPSQDPKKTRHQRQQLRQRGQDRPRQQAHPSAPPSRLSDSPPYSTGVDMNTYQPYSHSYQGMPPQYERHAPNYDRLAPDTGRQYF